METPAAEGTSPDAAAQGEVDAPALPSLRVERGNPSPAQLAALTAVLSAAGGGVEDGAGPRTSSWVVHGRAYRPVLTQGLGGWRASALPR